MTMLIQDPTRILFFTGKGGVGKTSAACATAIGLADAGKQVLLVSTDPASNLDEVLGVELTSESTSVPGAPGLFALNIDPEEAAHAYRERIVAPYRGVLPEAAVASIEEQLSGACTMEVAAFDEFSELLGDPEVTRGFDHVIFDTAPTGHTLRLLELPAAWSSFIETNVGGTSCLGPLSGLQAQQELYAAANAALRDGARTTLILVARPDDPSLTEAERTRSELVPARHRECAADSQRPFPGRRHERRYRRRHGSPRTRLARAHARGSPGAAPRRHPPAAVRASRHRGSSQDGREGGRPGGG